MSASVTHFLPLTNIRRARLLPAPGRVLVRPGQQVSATDIIAETYLPEQHVLLDVRRALGLSSISKTESLIERKEGEKVQKGDVLAETGGLFSRVIRVPVNGVIVSIAHGQVLIEVQSAPFALRAGLPGTISEVISDRGVILENSGALVQGVWGNNQIDMGLLLVLARAADEELTRDRLDVSMRGAVAFAGYCADARVLQTAAELPLRGLVLGSMSPDLVPTASGLKLPVLVIEGFGRIPLNNAAYKILSTNEKRDIALNAAAWNLYKGDRPEVFIPLPANGETAPETVEFAAGQTVRIQGAPYTGQIGTISAIRPGLALLQNGLRAASAEVRLENSERVLIPLSNLDVLE
jgi:hypothetical protein